MSHAVGIDKNSAEPTARPGARLFTASTIPTKVRLFYTDQPTPCAANPDLFFNPHAQRRAITQCNACPFRGRCSYNAVAVGATHGIWGGIVLPGNYPHKLAPIYAQLREQFDQRRPAELGHTPTTPLPDINTHAA
jgi:WhiB family redox-sensing transcriptional regulator